MPVVRAAVVQDAPVVFDTEATMSKIAQLTGKAAKDGAELVLFPEAFVSGYPKGLDFGARLGMRTPEGRRDFRRYFESSIEVPGIYTEKLAEIAYLWSLGKFNGELSFSVRNLTDEKYIAFTEPDPDGNSYQPGPGREFFVNAKIKL